MNLRRASIGMALGASVVALAACGGGGGNTVPAPGPTCFPNTLSAQLLYPQPGATNVPDALTQIVIAVSSPLPDNTFNLALAGPNFNSQTANGLVQIAASQVPPGSAPATIPNPAYESVQLVNGFPAAQQITAIGLNDPNSTCTPYTIPGASFTTQ